MSNSELLPQPKQWLNAFPRRDWYFEISPSYAFTHPGGAPESQGGLETSNLDVGLGAVALLKERGCDFTGPALEIGCGIGLLTVGLVASQAYPSIVITDPCLEFLHLTRSKLEQNQREDDSKHCFATLSVERLSQLPENTFSLIILRSVMRHTLDAEDFIAAATRALKPGGVLCCEELCAEGCKVMGLLAQFIPVVMGTAGTSLTNAQVEQLRLFSEMMGSYLSPDVYRSETEGKHLFHLSEMMKAGERCGLSTEFFPNLTLGDFLHQGSASAKGLDSFQFLKSYLREVMNFDEESLETFDNSFAPYTAFMKKISQGGSGLPFHGIYLWSKPKSKQARSNERRELNIATLNTYDLHGGAARAAWRLHAGLLEMGQHSRMLVLHQSSEDPDVQIVTPDRSEEAIISLTDWNRAAHVTIVQHRTTLSETYFTAPVPSYDMSLHPSVRASDVVHLHWVSGMLSPEGIHALQSLNKPIVWTLHDQRAFTGGCHYSAGCVGYQSECDACPQLNSSVSHLPRRILQGAVNQIDPRKITVVCPSKWLADCAKQSAVFRGSRIEVIPYGLETELYIPRAQASARRSLGIPTDGFCFLFGAHSATERRKGTHVLLEATRIARLDPAFQAALDNKRVFFLTYGCDSEKRDYQGIPIFPLGYIDDAAKMAMAYSASDVYVCPTLEDNLPNTVLESLSCGRPVIGSNVGGVPDMVRDGINGRLFPVGDSHALAKILTEVIRMPDELVVWGVAARKGIEAEHRLNLQAARYLQLYEELLRDANPMPQGLAPECDEPPLLPPVWNFLDVANVSSMDGKNSQRIDLDLLLRHDSLKRILAESSGRHEWPYKSPAWRPMPAKLPSGRPWPRISIVTPSYNQGQYIEQTILSIANQNYPDVEHIVIDGASTDETVAVLEKYSPLLSSWVSEKDGGQSNAINKGFAKATGEIITWLNSDDLLAPGALAAIALAFDTSGADMVAGICQLHRDGEIFDQHLTSCADGPLPISELLDLENHWMSGQFFFQPEVFFKRDLLLKVGGNVNEQAHWSMDFELWVRFAQAGATLKVIGRPIAQFRVHEEQKTQDVRGFKEELRALIDKLRPTLQLPPPPPPIKGRKKKLKIVVFNDLGFSCGAGIAHKRVARAALLAGHEVIPISVGVDNLTDAEKSLPFAEQIVPYLKSLSPDLVLVGNIHAAGLDASFLEELAKALPTVFLLHDGWLLTGRRAYCSGCATNLTGCDESYPTSDEYPALDPDQVDPAWLQNMHLIQTASKLVLAANNRWTQQQIQAVATARQTLANSPVGRPLSVRLSVPLDVFLPRDQAWCREELKLPADKFILLFLCSDSSNKREETDHLVQAICKLNFPDLLPVCMGYNDGNALLDLPGLIHVGDVDDPRKQALLYSAADLFVAPSIEETFGQSFVEAAACGTPSVAYPVGGVPESLMDGVVGRLAKRVDPESLAEAIKELYLNRRLCLNLGWWGRCYVENEFSLEASSRTLFFVLREAVRLGGSDLVPKLGLRPKLSPLLGTTVLLEFLGFIKPSPTGTSQPSSQQIDLIMLDYYQSQLAYFRKRATPWWLKPKAWLAKINRDSLRKKISRNERQQKRAGAYSK